MVTRYRLNGPGIESQWGQDFPHPSRPALGPTQPTMGTGSFPGVKAAGAWRWSPPRLVPRSWKSRGIPLLTLWACVACYRVKPKLYENWPIRLFIVMDFWMSGGSQEFCVIMGHQKMWAFFRVTFLLMLSDMVTFVWVLVSGATFMYVAFQPTEVFPCFFLSCKANASV
jgi:hypothetical protein